VPDRYTDRGKWVDGWESRRRRESGHDWCLIRLGLPGVARGVVVDTAHFTGNFPEAFSLEGCGYQGVTDGATLLDASWVELLPRSALAGGTANAFEIKSVHRVTHVRLNIFPDGGVARLRLHGVVMPDWTQLTRFGGLVDVAAAEHGGLVVASSDMYFGSRQNLIMPGSPSGMADGWETRRRRGPGHDWVVIQLGRPGVLRRIEVDTTHFKGNAPGSCSVEVSDARDVAGALEEAAAWQEALPPTPLVPHARHTFEQEVRETSRAGFARFNIFPDGGVGRLRLFAAV
jgi:allantoicase